MSTGRFVNLDGTLIRTDRSKAVGPTDGVDLWWSGKHHQHGANIQVLTARPLATVDLAGAARARARHDLRPHP